MFGFGFWFVVGSALFGALHLWGAGRSEEQGPDSKLLLPCTLLVSIAFVLFLSCNWALVEQHLHMDPAVLGGPAILGAAAYFTCMVSNCHPGDMPYRKIVLALAVVALVGSLLLGGLAWLAAADVIYAVFWLLNQAAS